MGQYVASAILLQVEGQREPLLDSSMARLLERFFGPRRQRDIRFDPYLQTLSRQVLVRGDPLSTNWGMLDLAALVCKPRYPRCPDCPLRLKCTFALADETTRR